MAAQDTGAAGTAGSGPGGIRDATKETIDSVREEASGLAGRYVGYAAERLQSLGRQLRDKDVDALIHDAQDLGRRAPGAFFAGSVVAGFLLARFLKASSERAGAGTPRRDAPPYGDEIHGDEGADLRSAGTGGASGSGGLYGTRDVQGGPSGTTTLPPGDTHDR
jgi:hypothetical protein